jgi:hypothetical protein
MKRLLAGIVALGLLSLPAIAITSPTALAYQSCTTSATATVNPVVINPGGSVTFTATFRDCNGNGLAGIKVVFAAINDPCSPTFRPTETTTDANGNATTTVFFTAQCTCVHTLSATGAGITVTADVRISACLPFTGGSSSVAAAEPPRWVAWIAVVGGLVLVSGAGLTLGFKRRLAQTFRRR